MTQDMILRSTILTGLLAIGSAALGEPDRQIDPKGEFVPGELIVLFDRVPLEAELDTIGKGVPGASWREILHAPHPVGDPDGVHPLARVRVLGFDVDADMDAIDAMLEAKASVREAHPNWVMRMSFVPNDPRYN